MVENLDSCSFCGKNKDQVGKLIVSERVAICNECVDLCQELLQDKDPVYNNSEINNYRDPRELKKFLDDYVIGQDAAKTVLAVAVVNHYKRLHKTKLGPEINKANILMIGPTGSGKTLLAKTVARFLDVPFVIADATSITEAGYVGDDVESLISRLYAASGNSVELTQQGIVFVDEIDKISRKSESTSLTRDVSGEGVQQALLKLVEGTVCRIPSGGGRKHPGGDMIEIDTSNILFIAGGAFVGLEPIIKNRTQGSAMGFNASVSTKSDIDLNQVTPDDLVKFGMIPEFVGRFPTTVTLKDLERADMIRILTDVKHNYIEQYQWLFQEDDVELTITHDALESIVDNAMKSKTGARALHTELEKVLMPHMYNLIEYSNSNFKQVVIDREQVNTPRSFERKEIDPTR